MEREIKATGECAYFAASNSRQGFYSYYEQSFRHRVDRLYCIKGGPGTGKSTLMRRVARHAERLGWRVEYYYCSSDAHSLDAVLMFGKKESIGLLDATAPHVFEPSTPGVEEHVIDLGQFWDAARLAGQGEKIKACNRIKSEGYKTAYRMLCGVGEVSDALSERVQACLRPDGLQRTARRLIPDGKSGQARGERRVLLSDSVGMHGRVRLDTYLHGCERLCLIEDFCDSAYFLTAELAQRAADGGQSVYVSYHPVLPDRIDALFLATSKTAFVVCDKQESEALAKAYGPCRSVRMRRLMQPEALQGTRAELRRLLKLREALLDETAEQMKKVATAHFELERIYGEAMDFGAQDAFVVALCRTLFDTAHNAPPTKTP